MTRADMPRLLAIDPGSEKSAWLVLDLSTGKPEIHGISPNEWLLERLRNNDSDLTINIDELVVEWMQPRGMPTSAQEFETMWWVGRFTEAAQYGCRSRVPWPVHRLTRHRVKVAICGRGNATDVNIRAALIDRFGGTGGKEVAVGRKAKPGPLFGIANDVWAALALACAWQDGAR